MFALRTFFIQRNAKAPTLTTTATVSPEAVPLKYDSENDICKHPMKLARLAAFPSSVATTPVAFVQELIGGYAVAHIR